MKWKKFLWLLPVSVAVIIAIIWASSRPNEQQKAFSKKADLLREKAVTDNTAYAIGSAPVDQIGHVVFFSVSDGTTRAKVYTGKGKTLAAAWDDAVRKTMEAVGDEPSEPRWVRADVVSDSWPVTADSLLHELDKARSGMDFNGLAFDPGFETALLEGELNGRRIYDYKKDDISFSRLNEWMDEKGKEPLQDLPGEMTEFKCWSWFCGEDDLVYALYHDGADTGRRLVSELDADCAQGVIDTASSYLADQVKEDGHFIYGYYPQYDEEIDNYNILRHSGTIWALICRYRMFPDEGLREKIERTIDYMLSQIRYADSGAGYLHEAKSFEYKLGGNGIAVVAMTEYMDVFQDDRYREACISLGEGILEQQDPEDGSYWHILNNDLSRGEDFRTVYYDGECTFALTRLYSLTGDRKWLDAACKAIDHFIAEDYTMYRDHWVAYSLNEVTKYVDKKEYYDFALANAVNNYGRIMGRERTYPTNLELLISCFETWQRMVDKGMDTGDFKVEDLLYVIAARADRQLSGYFYPELAMYMQNPQRIQGSFMMRDSRFRVRIDDVQHNIGGFYLYWKNYDAMLAAGLNPNVLYLHQ